MGGDLAAEPMDDVERGARRPPPVNSDTLPLPWTGRLGYVRSEDPGSSHGQPAGLAQTTKTDELEHATKNRPDKSKPADVERGARYVQELGLANARDIVKMLRWNDKYGIKFMRLSSEMFPFASHAE